MNTPLRLCLLVLVALLFPSLACKLAEGEAAITPAPTLPPVVWAPAPFPQTAITLDTAAQVMQVARWGMGRANDLAGSADGRLLVVAAGAGLAVYETTGYTQVSFIETEAAVTSLALSPAGELAAAGLASGDILLWERGFQDRFRTLEGHRRQVSSLEFSPDGALLASGSEDQTARLWRASGEPLRTLEPHKGYGLAVTFSPDGRRLAVGSQDIHVHGAYHTGGVKIWDVQTGELVRAISEDTLPVGAVAFSPDGQRLFGLNAFANDDAQAVWVWDAASGEPQLDFGGDYTLAGLQPAPDGAWLAVAGQDGDIRLYDPATGDEIRSWQADAERALHLAIMAGGERLASAGWDGQVKVWDSADGELLAEIDGFLTDAPVYGLAFSPDGERLASAWGGGGAVRVAEVAAGREIYAVTGDTGEVNAVAFSPDGVYLASAGHQDEAALLWNAASGELLRRFSHGDPVVAVAFSPDSSRLATAGWDRTARIWDAASGAEILSLSHNRAVKSLAFSPDGSRLATGSEDGQARVWDVSAGSELSSFDLGDWVESVAFSPDGRFLAAGAGRRVMLHALDGAPRSLEMTLPQMASVQAVAFSPDGSLLAAGCYDDTQVYLWDTQTGRAAATLRGHTSAIWSLAFAPNGRLLASGSADGTIRLWGILP